MPTQQLANYAQTTLSAGCTNVATLLSVVSVAGWPTVGNFRLRIDDVSPATTFEIVEVTSVNVGANQVTVTRALENTSGIAHNAGAFVGNDLTAAMLGLAFGQGTLGYAQAVATQSGISTVADLTSLSAAVTVGAGRRIRISCQTRVQSATAAGNIVLSIQEGATILADAVIVPIPSATGQWTMMCTVILTPSTGAHTYKLTLQTSAGTVNSFASATEPAFILVEDIGV